ncbi:hypothetical protein DPMN_058286 [Dreissena polymorpha]|uniref:Bcl-2 Bcl-2 homology region 1-3 domain-containing protein n=1 Tax=Dreissena polymorpha TaxID=45954 RepID=A0A9D4C1R0_DREPO|nr:hypothetical protein DPMN_058286 [Dreissena polymorpha]
MAIEISKVSITTSLVISDYVNNAAQRAGFIRFTGPVLPSIHCDKCKTKLNILLIAKCDTCNETNLINDDKVEACAHIKESKVLRELCDEFATRYEKQIGDLYSQNHQPMSIKSYWTVLDSVIENNINWGRIVAIVYFSGVLAVDCLKASNDEYVDKIIEWTCAFFAMKVDTWIADNTGWGGIAALKENIDKHPEGCTVI